MSSQPSEPAEPAVTPAEEPSRGWATWRKTMFAGALVLLANALAEALMNPDQPEAIKLVAQFVGFGCLAAGFGLRMRGRSRS